LSAYGKSADRTGFNGCDGRRSPRNNAGTEGAETSRSNEISRGAKKGRQQLGTLGSKL